MSQNKMTLSIRLDLPDGSRFGPGKAQLLRKIDEGGSIAGGARALGMSYPRALRLVKEMNDQFSADLVVKFQGGAARGGAALTDLGREVLKIYEEIDSGAVDASRTAFGRLDRIIRRSS